MQRHGGNLNELRLFKLLNERSHSERTINGVISTIWYSERGKILEIVKKDQ